MSENMPSVLTKLTRLQITLLAAGGSLALLLGAFAFQAMGYLPCKMCLWQRWPHAAAIVFGAMFIVFPRKIVLWLGAASAAITAGIGAYHTGVERDWWEGPTSCTGGSDALSGLSGAELLPSAGAKAIVLCDEVSWQFLGLSMASYNVLFSAVLVGLWIWAARKPA